MDEQGRRARVKIMLHEDMVSGDRAIPNERRVIQYEVLGLPPGQTVLIRDMRATREDGRWRVRRGRGEWEGDYESAESALAALGA